MNQSIWAMYFSATGTTQKVVSRIASGLSHNPQTYDFTLPQNRATGKEFTERDLVVFGVPVYAGRVPNVLLKYLAQVKGNGALAIPIVLYGNRNFDDGLIELRNILEDNGFRTIAAGAFIGEHSFSKILASGRPDQQDLAIADEFAKKLKSMLEMEEQMKTPVIVKGENPIRPYYQPRDRQGNPVDIRKVKPKTKDTCDNCKICAQVCPMGSINDHDVTTFHGICIKCGACEKKCPKHAKYYDDEGYLYHKTELELGYKRRAEPELFY